MLSRSLLANEFLIKSKVIKRSQLNLRKMTYLFVVQL